MMDCIPRSLMMQMLSECNGRTVQSARIKYLPISERGYKSESNMNKEANVQQEDS